MDEGLGLGACDHQEQPRIGTKLPGTHQPTGDILLDELIAAFLQGSRKINHGIDTRELSVKRLTDPIRNGLEPQTCLPRAGIANGSQTQVSDQTLPVLMGGSIDQLHQSSWHMGRLHRLGHEPSQTLGRRRMRRVGLGNHRISRRDGRREIPSGYAVEGKREIVRTKDRDGPKRDIAGPYVRCAIDHWHSPVLIHRGLGR